MGWETAVKLTAMSRLNKLFLEPVNTITHLIGALASLLGLVLLIFLTWDTPYKMISLAIYGICQVVLYIASCLLHGVHTTPKWNYFFNRLDHMAIFAMIAGVYTPIAYNLIPDPWRWRTLVFVWSFAFFGMVLKMFKRRIHGFFNAVIYLLMAWGVVMPVLLLFDVTALFSPIGLWLLLGGGLIYSVGFFIYYFEKPDPWPTILGHHEIWHLFVMAASGLHFLFMLIEVVPAA